MAYKMFAAIDVGSTDISMKIFEVSVKNGFREIDYISNIIELGSETYQKGVVSAQSIDMLCATLNKFKKKMKEYDIEDYYKAYATSAIREAENSAMIIDQIYLRTGLKVEILNNAEHRFLMYKGLAVKTQNFDKIVSKNTAVVDIGAGSIQISVFNNQKLTATQNILLGALRVRDRFNTITFNTAHLENVIEEYIGSEISTFRKYYLKDKEIKNIIAIGDEVDNLIKVAPELNITDSIDEKQWEYIYNKILEKKPEELSVLYSIPFERATLLLPAAIIYRSFLKQAKADLIWTPNIVLCDGIVVNVMEKEKKLNITRDFNEDILYAVYNLAKRYRCDLSHIDYVSKAALTIFDKMKKMHGLGEKEKLQLQIAAMLHSCGRFVNMNDVSSNSYGIIMSTEIMGVSQREREEIANVVQYNTRYMPDYSAIKGMIGNGSYIRIAKLTAILRIANALDKSHKQKINAYTMRVKDKKLTITVDTLEDLTLEQGLFVTKADFFEKVFGIRPILRQKRSV